MNNKAKSFKIIVSIVSALSIVIIELIKNKTFKYSKKYFSEFVKCLSPNELRSKKIKEDEEVILTGKIKRIDENLINKLRKENFLTIYDLTHGTLYSNLKGKHQITIKNKFSEFFPYNNVRIGDREKLNSFFKFIENIYTKFPLGFFLLFKNERSFRNGYLVYDDMISSFGKIKKNLDINKIYFEPIIIAQGNKNLINYNCMKNQRILENIEKPFILSLAFCVATTVLENICNFFNFYSGSHAVNINNYLSQSDKFDINCTENCKKCNKNYKNVIFLKCNHFVFCFKCYTENDKKCPLCQTVIDEEITILKDYSK